MAVEFVVGDCRDVLEDLGRFDFAFADPPFNIGQKYNGYDDTLESKRYRRMVSDASRATLDHTDGVVALHGPKELLDLYLFESGKYDLIDIINWHFNFGVCTRSKWIETRAFCCLIDTTDGSHTWNPEGVLVESHRAKIGDKRIHETENGGQRLPGTVWGIPSDGKYWGRVQGNNKERWPECPNQLPVVYLARLILAYTNPGDLILDPFCGSGTTALVADVLGRDCITIDVSEATIKSASRRVNDPDQRRIAAERAQMVASKEMIA